MKVALEVIPNPARGRMLVIRGQDRMAIPGKWVLDLVETVSREGAGNPVMATVDPLRPTTVADWMAIKSPTFAGTTDYDLAGTPIERNAVNDYVNSPVYTNAGLPGGGGNGPTYPELNQAVAQAGAPTGPELCRAIRATLTGDDEGVLQGYSAPARSVVAVLAAALFGCEPARNPRAMLVNLMYLDLAEHRVSYGGGGSGAKHFELAEGVHRNAGQGGWRGTHTTLPPVGKIPMAQGNSVVGGRGAS
jgi:hypothetical protein